MPSFASGMLILVIIVVSKGTSKELLCRWSIPTSHSHHLIQLRHKHTRKCAKSHVFFTHAKNTQFLAPLQFVIQTIKVHCYYKSTHSSVHRMSVGKCCQMTSSVPLLSRKQYSHWLLAAKYVSKCFHKSPKFTFRQLRLVFHESGDEQLDVYLLICSVTTSR